MLEDRPSRTAQQVALRRAAHQIWDTPRVLEDPLALMMIDRDEVERLSHTGLPDPAWELHLRAFVVARSRYAEDELAQAVQRGVEQYVVLGAGLDTFAYRNPFARLRVFEVDHPATQAWKQRTLEDGGIPIPASLSFAPVDFKIDTLAHSLQRAGFFSDQPAFFSWLGVTVYLPPEIVFSTLRWVASICPGNGIVFDYSVPRSFLGSGDHGGFDVLAARAKAAGEPFVGFFDPKDLAHRLQEMGFANLEDLDTHQINARYFSGRCDSLRTGNSHGRLIS